MESEYKGKLSKKEFNYNELKEKQLISQNLNTEITKIQEELNQINTIYSDLKVEKDKLQDNKPNSVIFFRPLLMYLSSVLKSAGVTHAISPSQ